MLLRAQCLQANRHARFEGRQAPLPFRLPVVEAFLVDREKSRNRHARSGGAKEIVGNRHVRARFGAAGELGGYGVDCRVPHLTGDSALPDELVELCPVTLQHLGERFGSAPDRCRPNRLVRFLRVLRAGAIDRLRAGHIGGPERVRDVLAKLRHRIGREGDRIGPHVGDEAHCAIPGIDALVELLWPRAWFGWP